MSFFYNTSFSSEGSGTNLHLNKCMHPSLRLATVKIRTINGLGVGQDHVYNIP